MKQEDYLMRIIEEMGQRIGKVVARLLQLQEEGEPDEAHDTIAQAVEDLINLPMERLLQLDADILIAQLKRESLGQEQTYYLAKLLQHDAAIYSEGENDTAVYMRHVLALQLWLSLDSKADDPLVSPAEIGALISKLNEFQHRGAIYTKMMNYYLAQDQFGEAENSLFDWLESDVALEDIDQFNPMEYGLGFYDLLEQLDDESLEAGGLPRHEVANGKAELLAFFEEE